MTPLFNRRRLRQNKALSQSTFERYSMINAAAEQDLAQRLPAIKKTFSHILVHGARLPILREALKVLYPQAFTVWADTWSHSSNAIVCEGGAFPFAPESFDLVISLFSLETSCDPLAELRHTHTLLKKGGLHLATFLGGDTLHEMASLLMRCDLEVLSGAPQRVAPMIDLPSASRLAGAAGFTDIIAEQDSLTIETSTFQQARVMLKALGIQAPLAASFPVAKKVYALAQRTAAVPFIMTFDVVTITAWKR